MRILDTYPPDSIYERVILRWPEVAANPYVVFAYNPDIYNPSGRTMPRYMIEHEKVHLRQQTDIGGAEMWWDLYLTSDAFRLTQELEAYRREYFSFCEEYADRNQRYDFLRFQALMLSSPLYGSLISKSDAMKQIKK